MFLFLLLMVARSYCDAFCHISVMFLSFHCMSFRAFCSFFSRSLCFIPFILLHSCMHACMYNTIEYYIVEVGIVERCNKMQLKMPPFWFLKPIQWQANTCFTLWAGNMTCNCILFNQVLKAKTLVLAYTIRFLSFMVHSCRILLCFHSIAHT